VLNLAEMALSGEATRDPATGLGTALALFNALGEQVPLVDREQAPLALLHIALERIDGYNLRFGPGGEANFQVRFATMLRDFAEHLADPAEAQPGGQVFRIGEGAFALLIPATGHLLARRAAAALLAGAEAARVGLSIGIGVAEPGASDLAGLLLAADGALRLAQERGGSRARLLTSPPPDAVGAVRLVEWLLRHTFDAQRRLAETTQLALTDPLTGLPNQRALELFLRTELPRAARHDHPLALLLIDGDSLRDYNTRHGYAAGDEWIKALAQVLTRETRGGDLAVRWRTGDEFVVALPETTREAAVQAAERIRQALPHATERLSGPATISIGVAAFPHDGQTREELLARAERANRRAKRLGKNRISFAEGDPEAHD
jgi:diguanylate cyclase (GGDEF)-like protein